MSHLSRVRFMILALLAGPLACTWVDLSPRGQDVRLVRASEVADCEKVGQAWAKTADRAAVFSRSPHAIREELATLGRNEAAALGGNRIVPQGPPLEGTQKFDVYRCEG